MGNDSRPSNSNHQSSSQPARLYSSDRPITSKDQDRFQRFPFARRIAETISGLEDPSSIVIGIYGAWGEGKTSVLNLMEGCLKSNANIVVVRFNPWYFESSERLLRAFFETLAEALGKSLAKFKEKVGDALNRYGAILSAVPVGIDLGAAAKGLGETIATAQLGQLRDRVEVFLREEGKRLVIMIDDIDRLERGEVQVLFKLIKLSADFPLTAYVLAFDDEMVAAALGERYGAGNVEAGRNFLEKIVQVPLHLPPADQLSLRRMTFESVDAAVRISGIELTEEQAQVFVRHFLDGFEVRLNTPRQARRYGNALAFALPILKGDVHPVDQMLIEGLRVFYPVLYAVVRDNPDLMTKGGERGGRPDEQLKKRTQDVIAKGFEGLLPMEEDAAKGLLQVLFPRLKGIYGNTFYGSESGDRWAQEQRVASEWYFGRYFHYTVPPGDVSDVTVKRLIEEMAGASAQDADTILSRVLEKPAVKRFIAKLRHQAGRIPQETAAPLALAIARQGALYPNDEAGFSFLGTHDQAAILVGQLVGRISGMESRQYLAKEIIKEAIPLPFASECFRWLRSDEKTPEAERRVPKETEHELGRILAERVRDAAEIQPLYIQFREKVPALFWVWDLFGITGEVGQYLADRFRTQPSEATEFLRSLTGKAWSMESGLPLKADFGRDSYDAAARLIDPQHIMEALRLQYGAALDAPQEYLSHEHPYEERLAHQFASMHQAVLKESASAAAPSTGGTDQTAADETEPDDDGLASA